MNSIRAETVTNDEEFFKIPSDNFERHTNYFYVNNITLTRELYVVFIRINQIDYSMVVNSLYPIA